MNLNMIKCHLKHLTDIEVSELLESVSDEMEERNKGKIPASDLKTKEEAKEFLANLISILGSSSKTAEKS